MRVLPRRQYRTWTPWKKHSRSNRSRSMQWPTQRPLCAYDRYGFLLVSFMRRAVIHSQRRLSSRHIAPCTDPIAPSSSAAFAGTRSRRRGWWPPAQARPIPLLEPFATKVVRAVDEVEDQTRRSCAELALRRDNNTPRNCGPCAPELFSGPRLLERLGSN